MNCSEVQILAASLVDNEQLSSTESSAVLQHLRACSMCEHEYEMEQLTALMVRARIPLVDVPPEMYHSILSAIEAD